MPDFYPANRPCDFTADQLPFDSAFGLTSPFIQSNICQPLSALCAGHLKVSAVHRGEVYGSSAAPSLAIAGKAQLSCSQSEGAAVHHIHEQTEFQEYLERMFAKRAYWLKRQ